MSHEPNPEEGILDAALDLPTEERAAFLDKACGTDARLRQLVEGLLKAHLGAGLPQQPAQGHSARPKGAEHLATEKPGDRIGAYKLLQQIGEGGCGVVYMAEQERPVRRRVALKVIKLGMDTKQVVARFEAERQALALMDHPNIAKVLDAGATEAGRPFFVMELVRGIRITDYCDQNNLTTRQRLELFSQVCRALQHAHQKGIIHRDIKPSNILVTLHDGVPVPKVIDFGIAKATDQRLTDKTLFTQFDQFIGTPAYMSPEQAEISGLDVDTRSDIYSLGVLLYELLTSRTPFDPAELMAAGLEAMRRTIRENEPPRPSTRLITMLAADLTTVARRRQAAAPKLVHLIKGDLDWIAMKALEKDRTRRYETADGLALDVQRYLHNEPVVARPPSQLYRFQKLVRRNKLAFGAASAVTLSILVGLGMSTWLFLREREARRAADSEARRSQQVALLLKDTLKGVGPSVALGRDITMLQEIMDKAVERTPKDLTDQPDVQAEMWNTIGEVYLALGLLDKAEKLHREARALQGKAAGRNRTDITISLNDLALVLGEKGKFPEAETLHREALDLRRKSLGNEHASVAESMDNLGLVVRVEGKLSEAEGLHRGALAIRRKRLGNESLEVATSLNNLGLTLREEGKLSEAETCFREGLASLKKSLGEQRLEVAQVLDNLAFVLREERKLAEAETLQRQTLAMKIRFLGTDHAEVATALNNLALLLAEEGKLADAEATHREALAMRRKVFGDEHLHVASSLDNLALALRNPGPDKPTQTEPRLREAETLERQALAMRQRLAGEQSPEAAGSLNTLGLILRDQGKLPEAETSFRASLALARKLWGDEHPYVAAILDHLLDVLLREHKFGEGQVVVDEVLTPILESKPACAGLVRARGVARARAANWKDARADFSRALELDPSNREAADALAAILAQSGELAEYKAHCEWTLTRFATTDDPLVAQRVARDCLIRAVPGLDLEVVGRLAGMASAVRIQANGLRVQVVRSLADYRRGDFTAASERIRPLLSASGDNGPRDAQAFLVLALASARSNRLDEARTSLAKGAEIIKKKLPAGENGDLGIDWVDIIVAQTLLREANSIVGETR